jgi:hypothetical protein
VESARGIARVVALLLVAAALPLAAPTAAAAACPPWCALDTFDDRVNGSLRSQGPWVTNQPGATDGAWATDDVPAGFSGKAFANQPGGIEYRSNAYATLGSTLAVANGTTGTLFLEFQTDDLATTSVNIGLSDVANPALGFDTTGRPLNYPDFEVQIRIDGQGLTVMDGGTFRVLSNLSIASDARYRVWLVADNQTDTFQVHVQRAGGSRVRAAAGTRNTFAFRNGTSGALGTYLNLNTRSPVPTSVTWVDNLHLADGSVLTDPSPAFEQVLDLENLATGAVNGKDGWSGSAPGASIAADATESGNQVLRMSGPNLRAHRATSTIAEGATGTLFFRMRRTGAVDVNAGLSDQSSPTAFTAYEVQANVQGTSTLNARDGGAFAPAGTFPDQAWQCFWLVADTAANSYELHARGGPYATRVQLPEGAAEDFGFRNGANAAALARLLVMTGGSSPGAVVLDDLAVDADGRNLRIPSGDAGDCPGTGGGGGDEPLDDPIPGDIAFSGTGITLTPFSTIPASSGSVPRARINHLGELPDGSGRLAVPDLRGDLWLLNAAGTTSTRYTDLDAVFPDFVDGPNLGTGFGFVAFHPQFGSNGRFYTVHTEAGAALGSKSPDLPGPADPVVHGVLTEWTASNPAAATFAGTRREVLRVGFDTFLHGIQEIGFDPTLAPGETGHGLLYVALGDGEENPNWTDGPLDLGVPQGKVLRIDPRGTNGAGGGYGIPSSNPFVGRAGALGEIYLLGLRNPHRFTWDPADGQLFVSNIGEANIDCVYRARAGDDYGWNVRECGFRFEKSDPSNVYAARADDGYVDPVAAYDHGEGRAIAGGFVYRGADVPALAGHYVFGDIVSGRVFAAPVRDMVRGGPLATIDELRLHDGAGNQVTLPQLTGSSRVDLRFGADADGELYVLSKANGRIWRVGPR